MLKGLGDIGNLMKLQKQMKDIQKKLKKAEVEGECADQSVKAVVNGEFELQSLKISEELAASANRSRIEKMVVLAVNDAVEKMKKKSAEEMAKISGGLNLPGM